MGTQELELHRSQALDRLVRIERTHELADRGKGDKDAAFHPARQKEIRRVAEGTTFSPNPSD